MPTLGWLPFEFQTYSTVADHYLYLALFGVALAVAAVLARAPKRLTVTAAVGLAIVLGVKSFVQTWTWKDDSTFFGHTLAVNPHSLAALVNLGNMHYDRQEYAEAQIYYGQALEIFSDDVDVLNAEGMTLAQMGKPAEGAELIKRAIARRPDNYLSHFNLGNVGMQLKDWELARQSFQRAVQLKPDYAQAWCNLGAVAVFANDRGEARRCFEHALQCDPNLAPAQRGLQLVQ
jgi:tetratricopeptide (TPR) repeat protein